MVHAIGTGAHPVDGFPDGVVDFVQFDLGLGIHQEDVGIAHDDVVALDLLAILRPSGVHSLLEQKTVIAGVLVYSAAVLVGLHGSGIVIHHLGGGGRRIELETAVLGVELHDGLGAAGIPVHERMQAVE